MKNIIFALLFLFANLAAADREEGDLLWATVLTVKQLVDPPSGQAIAKDQIVGVCEIMGRGDVSLKAPCNGVEVVLTRVKGGEVARTTADANGEFRFMKLTSGTYEVEIDSKKFKLAEKIKDLKPGGGYRLTLK